MAEVNTDIYKNIGQGPLTSMSPGSLVDLVRGIQTLKGQQQAGQLIQQNTDQNGVFNSSGAMAGIGQVNPLVVPQAVQNIQTLQQQQQDIRIQQQGRAGEILGSIADNPTFENYTQGIMRLSQETGRPPSYWKAQYPFTGNAAQDRATFGNARVAALGATGTAVPVAAVSTSGATPGATQPVTTGRFLAGQGGGTAAPAPQARPQSVSDWMANKPVAQPGNTGPITTALSPVQTKSIGDSQAALTRESNYPQEMLPWQEMNRIVQSHDDSFFGPGTQGRKTMEGYLQAIAPSVAGWIPNVKDDLKDYGVFSKYAAQAVISGAAGFSPGSDMQLATTISGRPNPNINSMSNKELVPMMAAVRAGQYLLTKAAADPNPIPPAYGFAGVKTGPADFNAAKAELAPQIDLRALAYPYLPPDRQADLIKSLGKKGSPAYAKFNRTLSDGL